MDSRRERAMKTLYDRARALLARATTAAADAGALPRAVAAADVPLERPRSPDHGDLSTNLCFAMAKQARTNPRKLAEGFVPLLQQADDEGLLAAVEVAGPGFVNLRLSPKGWHGAIADVLRDGADYGRSAAGNGERVLMEYVSANPTGPLHVGHGRGAVLGDALARVMRAAGYDVATEYYVNNVGNQISKLGESVWCWLRELNGQDDATIRARVNADPLQLPTDFPEDGYRGDYIAQLAAGLLAADTDYGLGAPSWDDNAWWALHEPANAGGRADNRAVAVAAWKAQLEAIRADLDLLDIRHDRFYSERWLHGLDVEHEGELAVDRIADCCERLTSRGWAFIDEAKRNDDGVPLSFKGTREDIPKRFRDTKDRVIIRSDGRPTYFAADIAYHDDKLARGFDHMIDILGADHHGYVPRLKGVIEAIGDVRRGEGDEDTARWTGDRLEVLLVQMVALLRDGEPVAMGKRSGDFVTLRDVVQEVTTAEPGSGRDAVRFIFLTRKPDAQLDFDLEVARRTSMDNPVYYVQYGHARLASILSKAQEQGIAPADDLGALAGLERADERQLAMTIAALPEAIARAARSREPHQVAFFLMDTCKQFHGYYTRGKSEARVITDDIALSRARLALISGLKTVIGNGLKLLGVAAPERMVSLQADGD